MVDGANDGAEGAVLGAEVGASVGTFVVGVLDGAVDGATVGAFVVSVGVAVVGEVVGACVGATVSLVGAAVGAVEGIEVVGTCVGAAVLGIADGVVVGAADGAAVGRKVIAERRSISYATSLSSFPKHMSSGGPGSIVRIAMCVLTSASSIESVRASSRLSSIFSNAPNESTDKSRRGTLLSTRSVTHTSPA